MSCFYLVLWCARVTLGNNDILVNCARDLYPGSLPLKNGEQPITQLPQSRRQVHDVLSAAESVPPISDSEVTSGPMANKPFIGFWHGSLERLD